MVFTEFADACRSDTIAPVDVIAACSVVVSRTQYPGCMITRSVTIEEIDKLYLMWNDHINASALYRRALREEMNVRDVDPDELRELFERWPYRDISRPCQFALETVYMG